VCEGSPQADGGEFFPVLSGHLGCLADAGDPERDHEEHTDEELGEHWGYIKIQIMWRSRRECISHEDERNSSKWRHFRQRQGQELGLILALAQTCTAERAQWALEAPAAFFPRAMQAFLL
jgi:hypothetical protein